LSLKLFAALVTVLGISSVLWVGVPAARRYLAIRAIERVGGTVWTIPRGADWLRKRVGDAAMRPFGTVYSIDLSGTSVIDADLARFTSLSEVPYVNLNGTKITDAGLQDVGKFCNLEHLSFDETTFGDNGLKHLGKLKKLRSIDFFRSAVTENGIKELEAALGTRFDRSGSNDWTPMWKSCDHCRSVYERQGRRSQLTYAAPGFDSCRHRWHDGASDAVEHPIRDGRVVLVQRQGRFGAFIPLAQNGTMRYRWRYRQAGTGMLDESDPDVVCGENQINRSGITFGPFSIGWSMCGRGEGWIYYGVMPGHPITESDVRICVTTKTDVSKIDPADRGFVYKGSPSDPGSPAMAPTSSDRDDDE